MVHIRKEKCFCVYVNVNMYSQVLNIGVNMYVFHCITVYVYAHFFNLCVFIHIELKMRILTNSNIFNIVQYFMPNTYLRLVAV